MGLGLQTLITICTAYPSCKELYSTRDYKAAFMLFNRQKILPLLAQKQAFWKGEGGINFKNNPWIDHEFQHTF